MSLSCHGGFLPVDITRDARRGFRTSYWARSRHVTSRLLFPAKRSPPGAALISRIFIGEK
jgi:hypothetical protein